jgi:hypothetical protein
MGVKAEFCLEGNQTDAQPEPGGRRDREYFVDPSIPSAKAESFRYLGFGVRREKSRSEGEECCPV